MPRTQKESRADARRRRRDSGRRPAVSPRAAERRHDPARERVLARTAGIGTLAALAVAVIAALAAHVTFMRHAGALWRDECNTAAFASMRSLGAIVQALRYDSVPLLITLLTRAWMAVGLGSDSGLRVLGFLIGVGVIAALFASARLLRAGAPWASLAVLALNAWVIRGGDALRPLGVGMLFIVLAFGTLAWALERPRPRTIALAMLCAALAVHSVYSNVPLIAAMCLGGVARAALARSRTQAIVTVAVGAFAALTMLPYAPAIRAAQDWGLLVQGAADLSRLGIALRSTADWDVPLVWIVIAAGVIAGILSLLRRGLPGERERAAYALVTLVAGIVVFVRFLIWSRLVTQPWYYLPLMALVATSLDALLGPVLRAPRARLAACAVLVILVAVHMALVLPRVAIRQTNLDKVAATLSTRATRRDLVLVNPWFMGVTFHRYYHGAAPWVTIPPLADNSIHRYDLVQQNMREPGRPDSVSAMIARTFGAGGRVWLVGGLPKVEAGENLTLPPAPSPGLGWASGTYCDVWAKRVLASFEPRLTSADPVEVPVPGRINEYETLSLFLLTGRP